MLNNTAIYDYFLKKSNKCLQFKNIFFIFTLSINHKLKIMKRYTVEIPFGLDVTIGTHVFKDDGVLIAKFDHQGGLFHDGGINPNDEPHEINVLNALVQWENGQTTDAHHFLDIEEILLKNIDKWEEE